MYVPCQGIYEREESERFPIWGQEKLMPLDVGSPGVEQDSADRKRDILYLQRESIEQRKHNMPAVTKSLRVGEVGYFDRCLLVIEGSRSIEH